MNKKNLATILATSLALSNLTGCVQEQSIKDADSIMRDNEVIFYEQKGKKLELGSNPQISEVMNIMVNIANCPRCTSYHPPSRYSNASSEEEALNILREDLRNYSSEQISAFYTEYKTYQFENYRDEYMENVILKELTAAAFTSGIIGFVSGYIGGSAGAAVSGGSSPSPVLQAGKGIGGTIGGNVTQ